MIGTGAAILGAGVLGLGGSLLAGKAQSNAAAAALAQQQQMYNTTRGDLAPFRSLGAGAGNTLANLYGFGGAGGGTPYNANALAAFQNSPDYAFAQQQGIQGLTNQNASRGMLMSGANLKDIMGFSSGLASQNFNNYANRLMGLTQIGAGAAGATGQLGAQYSGQMSNSLMAQGQAQAGGILGGVGAINNGLSNYLFAQRAGMFGAPGSAYSGSSPMNGFTGVGASPY